ncbi:hypothetical protein MYF61_29415, partial [Klebsiella quasipneumoniae]|nr:hypothetical protein [Klebsiella quasipneumoniae]
PDYRRRDMENYNKAIYYALTYAAIWEDESKVNRMTIERGEKPKRGRVEKTIKTINKEQENY